MSPESALVSLEEARSRILGRLTSLSAETLPLGSALNRIAAADVSAMTDLPMFDNSAMDGYAVRATDTTRASTEPVRLRIVGKVAAGESFTAELSAKTCVRIFTGSPLPRGADAVVMQEDIRNDGSDTVTVLEPVAPWENVRFRGEDVKHGARILHAGQRVGAAAIGLLGASGIPELSVHRQPHVGILATGSELEEPGSPLASGRIYESNRAMIAALASSADAVVRIEPIVRDTLEGTKRALQRAFEENDVVITSGGVSVGEFDYVKEAFASLGGEMDLWRVAAKPGKPFAFGELEGKFLFGLPGNPVSGFVTFLLLARPALLRLQGAAEIELLSHPCRLAEDLVNRGDRRHFMRVHVSRDGIARLAGTQASHVLSSLAAANGLVDVPSQTVFRAGESVSVSRWEL